MGIEVSEKPKHVNIPNLQHVILGVRPYHVGFGVNPTLRCPIFVLIDAEDQDDGIGFSFVSKESLGAFVTCLNELDKNWDKFVEQTKEISTNA